jgi:hypothetical protein
LGKRDDKDFLVLCDGVELAQIAAPVSGATEREPIESTLWFDPGFAAPVSLARAARVLAEAAPALVRGGPVELVVAPPLRRQRFPSGASEPLAQELYRLARAWDSGARAMPSSAERQRALGRLGLDRLDRARASGALFVAVAGVEIDAVQLNELARLAGPDARAASAGSALDPLAETARLLAASGWTSFAVAARRLPDEVQLLRSTRDAESREVGGKLEHRFPLFHFPARRSVPSARASVALDLALDLSLAPWAHLVRAGSGALVAEAGAIGYDLARVANRRRLVVRPPEQAPGSLSRLEVRWSGGDGRVVPSSRWLRSGSPPEASAARLRALAAGDLELDPATSARFEPGIGGAEPTRICLPGGGSPRWVRLSSIAAADATQRPRVGPPLALAPGEAPCAALCRADSEGAPCDPTDRPGDLFLIEELESGAWAALLLPAAL